jgi:Phosphodiester glycosidase
MSIRITSIVRKRPALSLSAGIACLAALAAVTASPAGASPGGGPEGGPVPSGDSVAFVNQITWTATSPANGVTLLSGTYHNANSHPYWTDTIQAPTASPFTGAAELAEAGSATWATQTEAALTAHDFAPSATVLPWPDYTDDPHGVMGTRVRVGNFATQAQAQTEASALTAAGFSPLVEWTGFDAQPAPDAELLHVAIVDPHQFAGQVIADHGSAIASRQTVPAASAALGSLAATNGGFFTIDTQLAAVNGVNTGVSAYHGQLESLADGDRAALLLDAHQPAGIENLTTTATVSAGQRSTRILGLNRLPGSAEDCGVAGFAPTSAPRQNTLCTGTNDLVLFTPQFGAPLPTAMSATAIQAVLDPQDRVVSLGAVGGTLPSGDSAIQAIGTQAAWISTNVHVGARLAIDEQIRTTTTTTSITGARVPLTPTTSIASAGPMLLRDGRTAIDAVDEGVLDPRDLNDYTFSAYRHARTLVGIDAGGRVILVAADGVAGVSEGLTLTEEAALMRSLGAVDAMNLDGGGSTEFAVNGQLVNDASSSPLRPVGDTIEVVPGPANR